MKNINKNLMQSLQAENPTIAKCLKITLTNDDILAFTEYSKDLIIDDIVFKSSNGFEENKIQQYSDITASEEEVVAFIDNYNIKKDDVFAGLFNNAKVEIFYVDYNNVEYGKIPITNGFISRINFKDDKIYFSISGILSLLEKTIGETYSPLCRAGFCDKKCSLNMENHTFSGEICEIISSTEFICTGEDIINKDVNYFKYGLITFKSGKNKDKKIEIKQSNGSNLILNTKLFYSLEIGDKFEIITGCDKKFSTCIEKFNNAANFRGEPNLPRTTKIYKFY